MSKQNKSLFQCEEAKVLWEMADDANIEIVSFGDLYPLLAMPAELINMKVEVLTLHKFKEKDKKKITDWLNANVGNLD